MLTVILTMIIGISQISADTIVLKGTNSIYYRTFTNEGILCFQYKTGKNWSTPKVIDKNVSECIMTISSGDFIHIGWCKDGKIYYKTNNSPITRRDTIQWGDDIAISPSFCEPALHLNLEANGEFIYITWYKPTEGNPTIQEIWRMRRWLKEPPDTWDDPECLSEPYSKAR
jgi:hypothetical protein